MSRWLITSGNTFRFIDSDPEVAYNYLINDSLYKDDSLIDVALNTVCTKVNRSFMFAILLIAYGIIKPGDKYFKKFLENINIYNDTDVLQYLKSKADDTNVYGNGCKIIVDYLVDNN